MFGVGVWGSKHQELQMFSLKSNVNGIELKKQQKNKTTTKKQTVTVKQWALLLCLCLPPS